MSNSETKPSSNYFSPFSIMRLNVPLTASGTTDFIIVRKHDHLRGTDCLAVPVRKVEEAGRLHPLVNMPVVRARYDQKENDYGLPKMHFLAMDFENALYLDQDAMLKQGIFFEAKGQTLASEYPYIQVLTNGFLEKPNAARPAALTDFLRASQPRSIVTKENSIWHNIIKHLRTPQTEVNDLLNDLETLRTRIQTIIDGHHVTVNEAKNIMLQGIVFSSQNEKAPAQKTAQEHYSELANLLPEEIFTPPSATPEELYEEIEGSEEEPTEISERINRQKNASLRKAFDKPRRSGYLEELAKAGTISERSYVLLKPEYAKKNIDTLLDYAAIRGVWLYVDCQTTEDFLTLSNDLDNLHLERRGTRLKEQDYYVGWLIKEHNRALEITERWAREDEFERTDPLETALEGSLISQTTYDLLTGGGYSSIDDILNRYANKGIWYGLPYKDSKDLEILAADLDKLYQNRRGCRLELPDHYIPELMKDLDDDLYWERLISQRQEPKRLVLSIENT